MLVGAVLFATIVGRMSALAAAVNRRAAQQQQAHDNLAEFMQRRELPKVRPTQPYHELFCDEAKHLVGQSHSAEAALCGACVILRD